MPKTRKPPHCKNCKRLLKACNTSPCEGKLLKKSTNLKSKKSSNNIRLCSLCKRPLLQCNNNLCDGKKLQKQQQTEKKNQHIENIKNGNYIPPNYIKNKSDTVEVKKFPFTGISRPNNIPDNITRITLFKLFFFDIICYI